MSFFGQMRFEGGVYGQFDSGFGSTERMLMEFVGTEGRITLTNAFKPDAQSQLYLRRGSDAPEILRFPEQDLYLGEVEDLYDAAVHGKPQRIPLADTRNNIATIRACPGVGAKGAPVDALNRHCSPRHGRADGAFLEVLMAKFLLGIDIGTTGAKALVIDCAGNVVASATEEYPLYTPRPLWSEQNPEDWWQGVVHSVRRASADAGRSAARSPASA